MVEQEDLSSRAKARLAARAVTTSVARLETTVVGVRFETDHWLADQIAGLALPATGRHLLELGGLVLGTGWLARDRRGQLVATRNGEPLTLVATELPKRWIYVASRGPIWAKTGRHWTQLAPSFRQYLERRLALPDDAAFTVEIDGRCGAQIAARLGVEPNVPASGEDAGYWSDHQWSIADGGIDDPGANRCHVHGRLSRGTSQLHDVLSSLGARCSIHPIASPAGRWVEALTPRLGEGLAVRTESDLAWGRVRLEDERAIEEVWDNANERMVLATTIDTAGCVITAATNLDPTLAGRLSHRALDHLQQRHAVRDPRATVSTGRLEAVLQAAGLAAPAPVLELEALVGGLRMGTGHGASRFGAFQMVQYMRQSGRTFGDPERPDLIPVGAVGELALLRGATDTIYAYNADMSSLRPMSSDPIKLLEAMALERSLRSWRTRTLLIPDALGDSVVEALGAQLEPHASDDVRRYALSDQLLIVTLYEAHAVSTRVMAPSVEPLRDALETLLAASTGDVRASTRAFVELNDDRLTQGT